MNQHHAFVIEEEAEKGISIAQAWVEKELGMAIVGNPDIVVLRYGLFSVADARKVADIANGGSFVDEKKVVIISASRVYHEAQNALLKVFEEPPTGTYLFLVLPSLGGLLSTLRSRVQVLNSNVDLRSPHFIPGAAKEFLKASKEKRSTLIKKLANGKDEEDRREHRDEAIAIVNGIESVAYAREERDDEVVALLHDIATLRMHLYDRSAPVRMILEHLALVVPKNLV